MACHRPPYLLYVWYWLPYGGGRSGRALGVVIGGGHGWRVLITRSRGNHPKFERGIARKARA